MNCCQLNFRTRTAPSAVSAGLKSITGKLHVSTWLQYLWQAGEIEDHLEFVSFCSVDQTNHNDQKYKPR